MPKKLQRSLSSAFFAAAAGAAAATNMMTIMKRPAAILPVADVPGSENVTALRKLFLLEPAMIPLTSHTCKRRIEEK